MSGMREGRGVLYVEVEGVASSPGDEAAPGVYLVEVDLDLDAGDRATAALDAFHAAWGIENLDDFGVGVREADGTPVPEGEADAGSLPGRACFLGKLEAPAPWENPGPRGP